VKDVPQLEQDGCGPFSPASLMGCVKRERLEADVMAIAKPRPPGSEHHNSVRELCRRRFAEHGFEASLRAYGSGVNVVGVKRGFSKPLEHVVVSAHYDQRPDCAGADDNASGVAAVLETARVLALGRFDRTLVVACWDEGEAGQRGSAHYAGEARKRDERIILAVAYEAIGFVSHEPDSQLIPDRFEQLFPNQALAMLDNQHRGDFLTIVTDLGAEEPANVIAKHAEAARLSLQVLLLTEAAKAKQKSLHRSDHSSFWDAAYPALLVTDTGPFRNPTIHCKEGSDAPDTLDYDFAASVTRVTVAAIAEQLLLR
jgi:hypothetical protein